MVFWVVVTGKDKSVVLWSIHDHISTLATDSGAGSNGGKSPKADDKPTESPKVQARGIFQGHRDTVEDVQFCPSRYLAPSVSREHNSIYIKVAKVDLIFF